MQSILLFFLAFFARKIIKRHRPYIIGVTGTVGKSTITSHVALSLCAFYGEDAVRYSKYHYNGEFGLPLTIIGAKTGGKNPFLWFYVFYKAIATFFSKNYPSYLILEYGIDHPGEMEYLISIAQPDIAILSPVAPNHLEQFGTFELYRKAKLLLPKNALSSAIVHDSLSDQFEGEKVYFYGKKNDSHAHITSVHQEIDKLKVSCEIFGRSYHIDLPAFGEYQGENILPLYLVGKILEVDLAEISSQNMLFAPEPGRSSLLSGLEGSLIIDGSYNGGFESIHRGLESVAPFLESRRIILLLGDMRELGDSTEDLHSQLAEIMLSLFTRNDNVIIILVGPLMREYVFPRIEIDLPVYSFLSSREAGEEIQNILIKTKEPTLIYVKGSQNTIFLEEAITAFLADPSSKNLLCRQGGEWIGIKSKFFDSLIADRLEGKRFTH